MDEKIEKAIKLLSENGYAVKKLSLNQIKDAKECEESGWDKECLGCACSVCIMQ